MTPPNPGAIAIIQVMGPDAKQAISNLLNRPAPTHSTLAEIKDIDEALIVRYAQNMFQIMPHGGTRVIQRIGEELSKLGVTPAKVIAPEILYPEAETRLEAHLLKCLSETTSPCAVNVLLKQRELWNEFINHSLPSLESNPEALQKQLHQISTHSRILNPIINPPNIVLTGPPNVGKSTLTNLVMGTQTSITADLPGTTRDWVSSMGLLPTSCGELTIRWIDTPGLHQTEDQIEASAIKLAKSIIDTADCLILMHDPTTIHLPFHYDWEPDLTILNKIDIVTDESSLPEVDLKISANTPTCLNELGELIARELNITKACSQNIPWAFDETLTTALEQKNWDTLKEMTTPLPSIN